jgi:hypothetical protein
MTKLVIASAGPSRLARGIGGVAFGIRIAFVTAVISLSTSVAFGQSRVFYDGFEDGTANKWATDGSHAKGQVITQASDGGSPKAGTRFLSLNWTSNDYSGVRLNGWAYNQETFIRMWWRLDADVDDRDGAKLMRLGWTGALNASEALFSRTPGGSLHEVWYVGGYGSENIARNCYSNHNLDDRKWHKVEMYIKLDTNNTDGVIKTWFDGVLQASCYPVFGDTYASGNRWAPLLLPSNWSPNPGWEHDMSNHFYVDEVEIFTDQGTGASGSMALGTISGSATPPPPTAPAAPTNLRIVK